MPEPLRSQPCRAHPTDDTDAHIERSLERLSDLMRRMIKTVQVTDDLVALTPTQLVVLVHLDERQCLRIGVLAQALGAAQNTVSEVVSRLERSNLVVKERDPHDHRAVIVRMTAAGKAALEQRRSAVSQNHRALLEAMNAQEQSRFVEAFELMVSMAERARATGSLAKRDTRRKK